MRTGQRAKQPRTNPKGVMGKGGKLTRQQHTRLVTRAFKPGDLAAYYKTSHWADKKEQAELAWRELLGVQLFEDLGCILCGQPQQQWHHVPEGYLNLFREHTIKHLRPICLRCHKRHHRK